MEPINYVSVGIGFICIVVSVIVLISSLVKSDRKLMLNRLFIGFVFCNIGVVASDVVAWLMTERAEWYAFYLIRAANFLHYIFGAFILTVMTIYMLAYIESNVKVARRLKTVAFFLCALSLVLTIVSQFNGMYYTIDEFNIYHRGELFLLSQVIPVIGLIINIYIVLFYRKAFGRKASLFLLTYMILPLTALCIQMVFFGITFVNISTTLTALILYIGVHTEREKNMALRITFIEQQLNLQGEHYKMLHEHITETKRARHDLRHHLSVFQSYIESGETEKLADYVNEYRNSLPDDTESVYCENYAVNSILRHYVGMAKREGIQVDVRMELPENAGINDSDLCIVFGNCLENAIEACWDIENPFIKINSKIIGKMITITVDNSFDGIIENENGVYLSRKRNGEGEGIGIPSVKTVAKKYGASARFEVKGNVFQVAVMLRGNK